MIQSETRERFILDLVEQMPGAEIFEVHFFSPRTVSGVERGVAVVAARLPEPEPEAVESEPAAEETPESAPAEENASAEPEAAAEGERTAVVSEEEMVEPEVVVTDELPVEPAPAESADDSPYAPEPEVVVDLDEVTDAEAEPAPVPAMPERYTVLTATYRHTLKGPDRGKWEVSVKAEADAPLVTVDQVVRGVQRRAEDTDEVERMTGDEVLAVVDAHRVAAE